MLRLPRLLVLIIVMIVSIPSGALAQQGTTRPAAEPFNRSFQSITDGAARQTPSPPAQQTPNNPASDQDRLGTSPSATTVSLTLDQTIQMALKNNLGVIVSDQGTRAARGQRLSALSGLLPNLTATANERVLQENLATFGIRAPGLPQIVGPFGVFDARLYLSETFFDVSKVERLRAANSDVTAAEFSYQDSRNLVVTAAGTAYIRALSAIARVEASQAQLETAQALFNKAVDLHKAGITPAIDSLRAQVVLETRQQALIAAKNQYSKNLLDIARVVGLPMGQNIDLAEKIPFAPLASINIEEALQRALQSRNDLKSAMARAHSLELNRSASVAQHIPTVGVDADYGTTGLTPKSSKATYTASASLRLPVFEGGRIRGDVEVADAAMKQQQSRVNDLKAQIEYEVRSAFLDLNSASDQVRVATGAMGLAKDALDQSRDRFAAGIADNLEVIQAQEAFANANENYIASLFSYNLSKLNLARAMGVAEREAHTFVEGK